MKADTYKKVVSRLKNVRRRDELPALCSEFPNITIATLGSIYSQENQKKVRRTHHYHYNPKQTAIYYKKFLAARDKQEKHILYRMSEEADFSPSQLARIVLEEYLMVTLDKDHIPKATLSKYFKAPLTIEDPVLSTEVLECIAADDHCGPFSDCIKNAIGHEYEFELKRVLDSINLPYIDEDVMREKGYDKTPDVKLEIPIAVDGYIVNWIESKASFGDEFNHEIYLRDQYWSYWNRFGAGMVIYWFGYIEELDTNKEKGIILKDSFPKNIIFFNPTGD